MCTISYSQKAYLPVASLPQNGGRRGGEVIHSSVRFISALRLKKFIIFNTWRIYRIGSLSCSSDSDMAPFCLVYLIKSNTWSPWPGFSQPGLPHMFYYLETLTWLLSAWFTWYGLLPGNPDLASLSLVSWCGLLHGELNLVPLPCLPDMV